MGYEMVRIPAGTFTMGCTPEQGSDCDSDEKPSHQVRISRDFYMGTTEVTQGLYRKVMGNNPSYYKSCGDSCPVEQVSWYDAVAFANKLSEMKGLEKCYRDSGSSTSFDRNCTGYALPTEAEWEYAARGGENYKYAGSNNVGEVAWYYGNSGNKTHAVGQKKANGYGLYDMSGNVYEWTWDGYGRYSSGSQTDPTGATSSLRVLRGGFYYDYEGYVRVSGRNDIRRVPADRSSFIGFRLRTLAP